jgi:para-nitrobenzyl esterase
MRSLATSIRALALSIALAGCRTVGEPAEPVVRVNQETLVGAFDERDRHVASFKGIPFASPPVGELRWQAPQPRSPRAGVRQAREFAPACYQDGYTTDWYRRVGAAFGADPAVFRDPPFSEDCLYLNVWTPTLARDAALPVMVWMHGGSNKAGWSFEPNYRGGRLAAQGNVVVVSIAYRVGIFGFFGHPELRGSAAPANFGLLDQIAALRWVQENIRQFGGDPANVTVFGESAGAADLGYLMTSPLARGLFRRAISESGGFQMQDDVDLTEAEATGTALAAAMPGQPNLAALRMRSSAEVFQAAKRALAEHEFGPAVDGRVLVLSPAAYYRKYGVPFDLMIGSNEDEWYMYVDDDPGKLAEELHAMPAQVRPLFAERAAQEPDVKHGHDKASTLANMVCPAYLMAASAAAQNRRAWVYRFTRVRPGPGGERLGAYHGAEIPYVFDTHDSWLSGNEVDTRLTTAMVAYWSNFARTGDPNDSGLASWPPFDPKHAQLQELGNRIGAMAPPDEALCGRVAGTLYPGWSQ